MECIHKINNCWQNLKEETNSRVCHLNLRERLPMISTAHESFETSCREWRVITGHKDGSRDENRKIIKTDLCLWPKHW